MDRGSTPHSPWTRSRSDQNLRHSPNNPVPPPPYTLQAPVRQPQPILAHDPFLPRRNDRSDPRQASIHIPPQASFNLDQYAADLRRAAPATASIPPDSQRILGDTSLSRRSGDGTLNGHLHRNAPDSGSSSLPPPPPSTSFAPTLQHSVIGSDFLNQQQQLRAASPRMYIAAQEHLPPPPPPFSARSMVPPSPQYNPPASIARVPPPPPPFNGGRELPALPSASRPGSSMSISSMLDSTPGRLAREPAIATNTNGASPTGSYSSVGAQPPPDPSPTSYGNHNGFLSRSSPERSQTSQTASTRTFRAYSGGTPQRIYTPSNACAPDDLKNGPLSTAPTLQHSPQSNLGTPQVFKFQQQKEPNVGRILNRPNSQPNGYSDSILDLGRKNAKADSQLIGKAEQEESAIQEASLRQASRDRVSSFDFLGRQAQLERQRQLELEKRLAQQRGPGKARVNGTNYPFLSQSSVFSEPSVSVPRPKNESVIDRLLESSYQPNSKGLLSDDSFCRLREERHKLVQQTQGYSPTASRHSAREKEDERPTQTNLQKTKSAPGLQEVRSAVEGLNHQLRNVDDGIQNHRSMLALINDDNKKRAGRISPLPQAVQGAQGLQRGPSSDPNIKNEFSRMFAGIGSGVGSAGLNSGASTPFPPSPKQNLEADQRVPFPTRTDLLDAAKSRNGSRTGKRGKRVKEDNSRELEITEARSATGALGTKGIKKSRHPQPHHHHVNHRHHHHHIDDQNGSSSHQAGNSSTPIPRHLHHHHHADGTIHFHSPSKSSASHHKTPRIPSLRINNNPILETVANLPRRHLGSALYLPRLKPSASTTLYDSTSTDSMSPYTVPRCDGKENCTLTVRIPRFYLSRQERKRVCRDRAVWGTDVYSDDSDPLAAAIHAGWIRGDWGDEVDVSMLELNPRNDSGYDTNDTVFTSTPTTPMAPLPGKDLHLTLLILPTLQQYTSRVAHGIKSRPWGSDHDGLSYRIEKIAWVDEKADRGEERHGESRHKRLKMTLGSRATAAPAIKLATGKGLAQARVATAAA